MIKVASVMILHCKGTLCPFVINKDFVKYFEAVQVTDSSLNFGQVTLAFIDVSQLN